MLPRTGDLLGRKYRLGDELGRGAMGIVYEARHETLDQRVAIKILRRSELDEEDAVRRFEREARIASKLDSRHVVKVMDVDRTDDGVPYLVMELLEGRDLSAEMDARGAAPTPVAEAVGWMVQVCEAMCVAHDAGVVHRDLKLSNVFLAADGTVKVLDFGVAVLRSADPERSTTMSVAGTPRYMAPEQLLGEPPNPSSDIWAIGVMLYRTLGGRFPYDSPTMAGQMLAMMEGCTPLATIAPLVPQALADVVGRALGHTLEQRWPSVEALALALAPFGTGAGVAPERAVEAPAIVKPRPPLPRLSLLAGAVALAALAAYALRAPTGEREPSIMARTPIDAALVISPPSPSSSPPPSLPTASTGIVSASPADAPSAKPPASARPPPRPAPVPPPPSPSAATDDGFPPHL